LVAKWCYFTNFSEQYGPTIDMTNNSKEERAKLAENYWQDNAIMAKFWKKILSLREMHMTQASPFCRFSRYYKSVEQEISLIQRPFFCV
jgi:hypothetical protein